MLTVQEVAKALPANLKTAATQALVDKVNAVVSDPLVAEAVRENFISYTNVLSDGKYKTEDYLNAVIYVSYKLMNYSNQDAYFMTFPQRQAALMARGASKKDISSYVAMYHKGKLVNAILEQTLIPSWVLNAPLYQEAINVQADLMHNSPSDKVRSDAANSLLTHLSKPKEGNFQINIGLQETSGMNEMRELLRQMASKQLEAIDSGVNTKEIAGQRIYEPETTINGTA
uniref:Small terminase subunit n=1 Tax=Pseudomonas phage Arace01 TaxID=3138526 RepID=A0AAU6VZC9_9VIRU